MSRTVEEEELQSSFEAGVAWIYCPFDLTLYVSALNNPGGMSWGLTWYSGHWCLISLVLMTLTSKRHTNPLKVNIIVCTTIDISLKEHYLIKNNKLVNEDLEHRGYNEHKCPYPLWAWILVPKRWQTYYWSLPWTTSVHHNASSAKYIWAQMIDS